MKEEIQKSWKKRNKWHVFVKLKIYYKGKLIGILIPSTKIHLNNIHFRPQLGYFRIQLLTPKKIFLDVSNPAAYILAIFGLFLSHNILQANLDIVLWFTFVSPVLSPGIVSITTKSMGASEDRPIWERRGYAIKIYFRNESVTKLEQSLLFSKLHILSTLH